MRRQAFENLGDMAHSVELDHEVQLARSELYKLAKYAIKLHNMMKDADPEQGLEGWVQADISKSAEAISKVYHSLEYEMKVSNNTSDLGSSHGGGEPEGALPFESVKKSADKDVEEAHGNSSVYDQCWKGYHKKPGATRGSKGSCVKNESRKSYKESLGRRLQKKTVNEAAPKIGDIRRVETKNGIKKSKYVKKRFGRGGEWKPFYDEETGPDPMLDHIAQAMLQMAEEDPTMDLRNKSELKAMAARASKEVAKAEGIPQAEMPKINNATVKNLGAQVVSAQKGGAPKASAPGAPAYPDPSDTRNQAANIQAPPPPKSYSDSAPKFPNNTGANTAAPVQQQQGGGQAPTGLKTAPLTQGVRVSKSAAKILYNRKAYNFAGQGKAAPGVGEVISVPWKALGMTPPPGKENVGATVELAHGRMWLTNQAPGPAPQQAPTQQAPAGVDPGLAAAAANPANASKTTANLPGPEAPGTVDHGFQQALNKAGLQPAAQQNVAQAPPAQLPAMDQNAQPAAQTAAYSKPQGGNRQDGFKISQQNSPASQDPDYGTGQKAAPAAPQQQATFAQGGGGMAAPKQAANPNALTPGVKVSGKMVKYNGTIFQFAGHQAKAPAQGQTIVVPPQAVGVRPKFKGQGIPVVLDTQYKQFYVKPKGQVAQAPQQKASQQNWDPEFKQGQQATSQQKNYFQQQRTGGRRTTPTGKNDASTTNYFQKQRTGG